MENISRSMPHPDRDQFICGMRVQLHTRHQVDRKSKIVWQEIDGGAHALAAIARASWVGYMKNSCWFNQ
jgi:hypothetical protein